MNHSSFRAAFLVVVIAALGVLAWGQGSLPKAPGMPKTAAAPIMESGAYLLKEVQKLKKQVNELQSRLAAVEAKNKSQDATIAEKENKTVFGSDYAGGGWCSKNVFLTALDKDKTMIRYVTVK